MLVDAHRLTLSAPARLAAVAAISVALAACSSSGGSSPSAAASAGDGQTEVAAALSEFKIELGTSSAPAGSVEFELANKGTQTHEFVVFRTDLAPDKLPLSADGIEVDEEGAGITAIDEVEDIEPGSDKELKVDLPAGHYVVICNLPAHYTSGMHAEFTTQ